MILQTVSGETASGPWRAIGKVYREGRIPPSEMVVCVREAFDTAPGSPTEKYVVFIVHSDGSTSTECFTDAASHREVLEKYWSNDQFPLPAEIMIWGVCRDEACNCGGRERGLHFVLPAA